MAPPNFPHLEEETLKFWEKNKVFEKSLEQTRKGKRFVFFEGPPTANGRPHIGHAITRAFKDIIPRYKTMRGFYVLRKGGWDTHGLPVELEVEKELGISGKPQIENLVPGNPRASIEKFNELCKKSVWKYKTAWEQMVKRIGHWIDLDHPYITYEASYIESVWWALKTLYDKKLLYEGHKVVPYCTRCGTPLSSHEVAQGYEDDVEDPSVVVKFELRDYAKTYLLAWTTTPWTLPGNVALAIDPDLDYIKVEKNGEKYLIAKKAAKNVGLPDVGEAIKGKLLLGSRYKPLYTFGKFGPEAYRVVPAKFVGTDQGTGVVHTAVMYGEEDFALGKEQNLPMKHLVAKDGHFIQDSGWLAGKYVKDADPLITHDLTSRNLLYSSGKIRHTYPFCWRCHSPLIYYALETWFIATTKLKEKLIENNKKVNWVPEYLRDGRMGNWYETLIDWAISRTRYWGTPLPIWVCDKHPEHKVAVGSFKELSRHAGRPLGRDFDPHRPFIDEITWKCPKKDNGTMKRVPDLIDVWFDAGSMPFAQWHYPEEGKKDFDEQFPADFISEAIDQTRGWFYTLQAISTLVWGKTPYKNAVVFSHALDEAGRKMSKHLGNVVDPMPVIEKYGADALRWFFFTSATIGSEYRVSGNLIGDYVRKFFLFLWNVDEFYKTYAELDGWKPGLSNRKQVASNNILDRWILARLNELTEAVTENMEKYDIPAAGRAIEKFVVDDLSGWYIRRSRSRVGPTASDPKDKQAFYETTWQVLTTVSKLLAPFIPFLSEHLYQELKTHDDPLSVHLTSWPKEGKFDRRLINEMATARKIVEMGLNARKEAKIRVRQPLSIITVSGIRLSRDVVSEVLSELNIKAISYKTGKKGNPTVSLDIKLTTDLLEEGMAREIVRGIQELRKTAGYKFSDKVTISVSGPENAVKTAQKYREMIERETVGKLSKISTPDAKQEVAIANEKLWLSVKK
jgi:isoleucyl-tRNA synthetase